MATTESIKPVNVDWINKETQGDSTRSSNIVSSDQSSSKFLPAEENSKKSGRATSDDIDAYNGENVGEDGDSKEVLPIPPDGGYGWVIVFAAFMSNFVVDGIANSFGAFMSIYQDYFNASKALVSLIGTLLIGSYLLIGPVVGGMVNKYGARMVVIIGSFIASSSILASIFCSNIYMFMIFYGFLGGAGLGLIYLPSIVTVGYYFEKKRSIATGIAVAGSGVGTFVLPPLCIIIMNQFGWRIAVCSLAALSFSTIIYGLLYRPLKTSVSRSEKGNKAEAKPLLLESGREGWKADGEDSKDNAAEENKLQMFRPVRNTRNESEVREFDESTPLTSDSGNITEKKHNILDSSEGTSTKTEKDPRFMARESMNSKTASETDLKASGNNGSFAHSTSHLSQTKVSDSVMSAASSTNPKDSDKPSSRRDIFNSGSDRNPPEFKSGGSNCQSCNGVQTSISASAAVQATSGVSRVSQEISNAPNKLGNSHRSDVQDEQVDGLIDIYARRKCKWIPSTLRNALGGMIDISLLKEPAMFLLCISNLCGMLGFYIPFMFLIDMAVAKGHTRASGSLLLSVIGITNTIGRIAFGWLADRGWLSALTINNFALLGCGALTCLCPLFPSYGGLMVYSVLFGFIISAYISLTSIVLVDELGLDRLTNSFGILVVSRGTASLLGTPLAGIVYDMFASYDASFYFSGVIIILSGLISCLIPVTHRCRRDEPVKETGEYLVKVP